MASAIFTEVIDVELNSKPLEASLTQLVTMYQSQLAALSNTGLDPAALSGLNVSAINTDLASVRTELTALTDAFMDSFGKITAASSATGEAITANIAKAMSETDDKSKIWTTRMLEDLSLITDRSDETWTKFSASVNEALGQGFEPRVRMTADLMNNFYQVIEEGGQEAFGRLSAQQQDWVIGFASGLAKVEDAIREASVVGTDAWQEAQMKMLEIQRSVTAEMETDFKKRESASEFMDASSDKFQKQQMGMVTMQKQATKEMNDDFKLREAAANSAAVVGTDAWQEAQMKQVQTVKQATKEMNDDFKLRAIAANDASIVGTDAWQEAQMKQVRMVKEATSEMEASFRARAEAAAKATSESGMFGSGLGKQIKKMAVMQVEWMAINAAISVVTGSVRALGEAFSSGFNYLSEMETKAADLQGVLASSVVLSQDQATNFKLTGEAAVDVQMKIQDASIKYGIAVETLDRGFKSFVNSGGASLTHSLDETVQIVTLLGAALKGAGKDAEATRSMLSEYPKLLDGSISKTSQILKTLGISADKWREMRAEALIHKDLLAQLTPYMEKYVAVAAQAVDRHQAMEAQLKLMGERLMAVVDKKIWDYWLSVMQQLAQLFKDNQFRIQAMAETLGTTLVDLAAFVVSLTKATMAMTPIGELLKDIVTGFALLVPIVNLFVTSLTAGLNVTLALFNLFTNKENWRHPLEAMKEFWAYQKSQGDQAQASLDQNAENFGKIVEGGKPKAKSDISRFIDGGPTDILDAPLLAGGKLPQDNTKDKKAKGMGMGEGTEFGKLKGVYAVEYEEILKIGDKKKEDIKLELALRHISIEEASKATIASNLDVFNKQKALIVQYEELTKGVMSPEIFKVQFTEALDKQSSTLDDSKGKADEAEQQKAATDRVKMEDQNLAQSLAAVKKNAKEQIAVIAARVKAGTELASAAAVEELKIINAEHTAEMDILQKELVADGAIVDLKQATQAKLIAANAAYTAAVVVNAEQRTKALLKENEKEMAAAVAKARADYTALATMEEMNRRVTATKLQDLQSTLKLAVAYQAMTQEELAAAEAAVFFAKANNESADAVSRLMNSENAAKATRDKANQKVDKAQRAIVNTDPIVPALQESLGDWKDLFHSFSDTAKGLTAHWQDFGTNLANTLTSSTAVMGDAVKTMTSIEAAMKQGGWQGAAAGMGAAGGLLSSAGGLGDSLKSVAKDGGKLSNALAGSLGKVFQNAGIAGAAFSAVSGVISMISSLFSAAAAATAAAIQASFKKTMQAFSDGTATLQQTIAAVQKERADAIAKLSGEKGGQAQLDKLLPELDAKIKELEKQKKGIIDTFEKGLTSLELHSTVLEQTLATWDKINASVKQYIDAGGDAAKAAQFISDSLRNMKQAAADSLAAGDQKAIDEAIAYNDLLVKRQALTDAYNKAKFNTLNADAIERRASHGVVVGMAQKTADDTYKTALTDLNSQIAKAATEVSMYKQIYQIASDTATLKAQSSALAIQDLAKQIQTLKDYQTVYNSIYKNPNGTYGTNNAAGTAPAASTTTVGAVNVYVTSTGPVDGTGIANTIQSELQRNGRYGVGSSFTTN